MPWDEGSLGLEGVLSFADSLGENLSVVGNFGIHIVNQEWLSECIFVISVWHGLEVKSHHGSGFNITEFVHTSGSVGVGIEELSRGGLILWEVWVGSTLVPLLIKVNNMVSLWGEESTKLLVSKDSIKDINLINSWLSTLVSNS